MKKSDKKADHKEMGHKKGEKEVKKVANDKIDSQKRDFKSAGPKKMK